MKSNSREKPPLALERLLEHYSRIDAQAAEVARLETLIEDQEKAAAEAEAAVPKLDELRRRREDVLADIILGRSSEGTLRELDDTLRSEEERVALLRDRASEVVSIASQTAGGLSRKLAVARAMLEELRAATPPVLDAALLEEAEGACVAYANAALRVKEAFVRLIALDQLMDRYGDRRRRVRSSDWQEAMLPTFTLPPCDGLELPGWPGILFSARILSYGDTFRNSEHSELARLQAAGFRL